MIWAMFCFVLLCFVSSKTNEASVEIAAKKGGISQPGFISVKAFQKKNHNLMCGEMIYVETN